MIGEADPEMNVVARLDSVSGSVRWLKEHISPDLIFLDINLGDGLSFGIFDDVTVSCPVIFTTAYDEYALKAFRHNGIDYLLKPVRMEELREALRKFREWRLGDGEKWAGDLKSLMETLRQPDPDKWKKRFVVNFGDKIRAVETEEVAYFMIIEKNTFLLTHTNDSYGIAYSLEQLDELLDPGKFFRVNRRFFVSFASIKNMWTYSRSRIKLELKPPVPEDVIVSTERASGFREWLNQ